MISLLQNTDSVMSMQGPLQRPVTPSQRKAVAEMLSRPPSQSGSRPATGMKDPTVRPPTRSGSRPGTQENEMRDSSKRLIQFSVSPPFFFLISKQSLTLQMNCYILAGIGSLPQKCINKAVIFV